jgi:peptidoglycan/xylan/chitin deacetylase (PgdA/CDA1 family)
VRLAAGAALLALGTVAGPALASIGPLRRRASPMLSGIGPLHRVALTFDDGPDSRSTPSFLDLLDRYDVRATFFLLGEHVTTHRHLVGRMAQSGHELAVHGWDHTCVLRKRPSALREELRRTSALLEDLTGDPVHWYRPPYGVLSTPALLAARDVGLQTVLWSAWGRDWERRATPTGIARTVERALRPGGTVLLHDTDRTSAPDSWRRTLAASDVLLADWAHRGMPTGPLGAHGITIPGRRALGCDP